MVGSLGHVLDPRTMVVKNGFCTSATMAAHTVVRCRRRARAGPDGWYPSSTAASRTRTARSFDTGLDPLSTRETVAGLTPAWRATSLMVVTARRRTWV